VGTDDRALLLAAAAGSCTAAASVASTLSRDRVLLRCR
jgi:hypothetical protein